MAENSKIEWTDHTFNPWTGCTKVSPGCANCYAEGWSKRSGIVKWGKGQPRRRTSESNWREPLKWNREAAAAIEGFEDSLDLTPRVRLRPRVFCASLADWLDDEVPIEWLADLLSLIRRTPNLDWLLLTKRPENWRARVDEAAAFMNMGKSETTAWCSSWLDDGVPPHNVWVGTTVEDQIRADQRIPILLNIPAKVRFLSCEPLLAEVDLEYPETIFPGGPGGCCSGHECGCMGRPIDPPLLWGIHWVITGGESGPGSRPFNPDWARLLQNQCKTYNVPFFMKQMGGARKPFLEIPADLVSQQFPGGGVYA